MLLSYGQRVSMILTKNKTKSTLCVLQGQLSLAISNLSTYPAFPRGLDAVAVTGVKSFCMKRAPGKSGECALSFQPGIEGSEYLQTSTVACDTEEHRYCSGQEIVLLALLRIFSQATHVGVHEGSVWRESDFWSSPQNL